MNIRNFLISVFIAALFATFTAMVYTQLPPLIPVHFDINGKADRFEPKQFGAWYLIYVMLGMGLLFALIPALSPKSKSIELFRKTYDLLTIGMQVFMGSLQVITLHSVQTNNLNPVHFGLLMCVFFGFLGNLLGKVTPNYYVGVRTPWTLESPENWERTHRLAARLSVGASAIGCLLVFYGTSPVVPITLCVCALLAPVGYSYWYFVKFERSESTPSSLSD